MENNPEDIRRLLNFKPGDKIWACNLSTVFSTSDGYFGHYFWGDNYNPWQIHCIEGKSPTVFKPMKLFYEGRFDAAEVSSNKVFVFANSLNPTSFTTERFILPLYYEGYKPAKLEIDAKIFNDLVCNKQLLRFNRVYFTEEECLKKCRDLNSNRQFSSGIGIYGKWYMKTLNKMKKELSECMKAEWVIDHKSKINQDLNVDVKKNEEID